MSSTTITCLCGKKFDFSERDQQFFAENNWPAPKRCRPCREEKKKNRLAQEVQPEPQDQFLPKDPFESNDF